MMTREQARVARLIAAAHSHEWATVEATEGLLHPEEIRAATIAARNSIGLGGGIEAPTVKNKAVTHTTGTGRLQWVVYSGGEVLVAVHRNGHESPVLTAGISRGGVRVARTGPACYRHWAALLDFVRIFPNKPEASPWPPAVERIGGFSREALKASREWERANSEESLAAARAAWTSYNAAVEAFDRMVDGVVAEPPPKRLLSKEPVRQL